MRTRRVAQIIAAVAIATVLTACGGESSSSKGQGAAEKTITTATTADVKSMDPVDISIYFTSGGDKAVAIYGTLMKFGEGGATVPAMAESFEPSEDGKVWTLKLRPNVKFTDGTPYDAEAVKFNLERHAAEDSPSPGKSQLADVKSMEVVDPLTLKITLGKRNGSFSSLFTQGSNLGFIASPTAIKKLGKEFGLKPVGAGPYVISEWVRDSHLTVERNKDYWDAANVDVEKITYKVIPDSQTQAQSLLNGTLNMSSILPPKAWSLLAGGSSDFTIYNQGTLGAASFFPNTTRGPGKSLEVRRAIQMAFDPLASNKVLAGDAVTWDGDTDCLPFQSGSAYCAKGSYPKHNLEEAKRIIAKYVAEGNSPKMTILTSNNQMEQTRYYQQVLNSIGLEATINSVDRASFSGLAYEGDYDAVVAMRLPFANPYPAVYNNFSATGTNYAKAQDPELQAKLDAARDALDENAKTAAWRDALAHINENAYAIWVAPAETYMASAKNIDLGNDYVAGGAIWYPADAKIN